VVFESPVPVLLDVHAEWCGPCKQLGPMLEDAAVRSGGLFRVAKLDSDKNKNVAEALQVTAEVMRADTMDAAAEMVMSWPH
jgi:thioredoxin-like negative regulator of GroEL